MGVSPSLQVFGMAIVFFATFDNLRSSESDGKWLKRVCHQVCIKLKSLGWEPKCRLWSLRSVDVRSQDLRILRSQDLKLPKLLRFPLCRASNCFGRNNNKDRRSTFLEPFQDCSKQREGVWNGLINQTQVQLFKTEENWVEWPINQKQFQ